MKKSLLILASALAVVASTYLFLSIGNGISAQGEDHFKDIENSLETINTDVQEKTIKLQISNPYATVDGKQVLIDATNDKVVPIIQNDRTMLPIRFIAENFDLEVSWDNSLQEVTLTGDKIIKITIDASVARVDNREVPLDCPAVMNEWRTFLPVRFISEEIGLNVAWNGATQEVTISTIVTPTGEDVPSVPTSTPTPTSQPTPPSGNYNSIKQLSDNLWEITVGENVGIINSKGEVVVPLTYRLIYHSDNCIQVWDIINPESTGVILTAQSLYNYKGEVFFRGGWSHMGKSVGDTLYGYPSIYNFEYYSDNCILGYSSTRYSEKKEGSTIIMNSEGNILHSFKDVITSPPTYNEIIEGRTWTFDILDETHFLAIWTEGTKAVGGLIDLNSNNRIVLDWYMTCKLSDDLIVVAQNLGSRRIGGVVDLTGKIVIPPDDKWAYVSNASWIDPRPFRVEQDRIVAIDTAGNRHYFTKDGNLLYSD